MIFLKFSPYFSFGCHSCTINKINITEIKTPCCHFFHFPPFLLTYFSFSSDIFFSFKSSSLFFPSFFFFLLFYWSTFLFFPKVFLHLTSFFFSHPCLVFWLPFVLPNLCFFQFSSKSTPNSHEKAIENWMCGSWGLERKTNTENNEEKATPMKEKKAGVE